MKFIARTSTYEGQPCEEAKREPYVRIDSRTVDGPAKIPISEGDTSWWYANGRNHRVEGGHIMRDFDDEAWFVEIATLDELMAFVQKYGNVIIQTSWNNHALKTLEIYDDYRE